ncbi:MAG: ATP phosphoribosyltransferase regulatory subunit [Pseudomonadota bacterium]
MARRLCEELVDRFVAAGATRIEAATLQPAATLLDLYGEDIRARAYTTWDAVEGEQMLRPDFTVPVVQAHMESGAAPARYAYAGPVFRKQDAHPGRAREYLQIGYELFGGADAVEAELEVFRILTSALEGHETRAVVGDIGLLLAAVDGLETSDNRKAALRRHIWRPVRFRALLDRFSAPQFVPPAASQAPEIGLRTQAAVERRLAALEADAKEPPLSMDQIAALTALFDVQGAPKDALNALRALERALPAIAPINDRIEQRLAPVAELSGTVSFQASYGRTTMEYYDGFVFGIFASDFDGPPLASGGRYDALTRALGPGEETPAVGGVLRPEMILEIARA